MKSCLGFLVDFLNNYSSNTFLYRFLHVFHEMAGRTQTSLQAMDVNIIGTQCITESKNNSQTQKKISTPKINYSVCKSTKVKNNSI